jgi:hypothetical protein
MSLPACQVAVSEPQPGTVPFGSTRSRDTCGDERSDAGRR